MLPICFVMSFFFLIPGPAHRLRPGKSRGGQAHLVTLVRAGVTVALMCPAMSLWATRALLRVQRGVPLRLAPDHCAQLPHGPVLAGVLLRAPGAPAVPRPVPQAAPGRLRGLQRQPVRHLPQGWRQRRPGPPAPPGRGGSQGVLHPVPPHHGGYAHAQAVNAVLALEQIGHGEHRVLVPDDGVGDAGHRHGHARSRWPPCGG